MAKSDANKESSELNSGYPETETGQVRRVVAGNPNTPKQILMRLASEDSHDIRRSVAENPKSPVEVLRDLSRDTHVDVRLAVAENPNTPSDTLCILATDADVDVRYGVAENPHMPESILFQLSQDENPYIRCRALKTMQMLAPDVQSRLKLLLQQVYLGSLNTSLHQSEVMS